jgi:hypothetical protein
MDGVRDICNACRRPIYEEPDPDGNPYHRHIDARFDMVEFFEFHLASPYVQEKVVLGEGLRAAVPVRNQLGEALQR